MLWNRVLSELLWGPIPAVALISAIAIASVGIKAALWRHIKGN